MKDLRFIKRFTSLATVAFLVAGLFGASASPASADEGTVKIHDFGHDESLRPNPDNNNENVPFVGCPFYIEFRFDQVHTGAFTIEDWSPGDHGAPTAYTNVSYTAATLDHDTNKYWVDVKITGLSGDQTTSPPSGHYKLFWNDGANDKQKVFWVNGACGSTTAQSNVTVLKVLDPNDGSITPTLDASDPSVRLGVAFNTGLQGWTITATSGSTVVTSAKLDTSIADATACATALGTWLPIGPTTSGCFVPSPTDATGSAVLPNLDNAKDWTICETSQAGYTQTFPAATFNTNTGCYLLKAPWTDANAENLVFANKHNDAKNPTAIDPNGKAATSFTRTYGWTITKTVSPTSVASIGGTVTLSYTIVVTKDTGTDSTWSATGAIRITNPNTATVTGIGATTPATTDPSATCGWDPASGQTTTGISLTGGSYSDLTFTCSYSNTPTGAAITSTVSWPAQSITDGNLAAGSVVFSDPVTFSDTASTVTLVHDSATITDTNADSANASPNGLPDTISGNKTYTYTHKVAVPASSCTTVPNTATLTSDGGYTKSSNASAKICGPGGLTMGFWKNPNGQGLLNSGTGNLGTAALNQAALGNWLRQFHAFYQAPNTGSGIASYVTGVINNATCSSSSKTCNSMLRAQMLATALDVYFSDPALGGTTTFSGHNYGYYSGLGTNQVAIGGLSVLLTQIHCGADSGYSGCVAGVEDASSSFGATSLTVMQMLTYQNTSDPALDNGAVWYAQVKLPQVLAKDAFDAINNNLAVSP